MVVSVLTSGRSRDMLLCTIARNIMLEAAMLDINLIVLHVLGINNTAADILSSWFANDALRNNLCSIIPHPVWSKVDIHQTFLNYSI